MKIGLVMPVSWEPLLPFLPKDVVLPEPLKFEFGANLAVELRRRGHEVHVFTLCRSFKGEAHIAGDDLHVHIGGYRRRAWLDWYRVESAVLLAMLMRYPCDILHAHWTYEFALPVVRSPFTHLVSVRDAAWKILWLFRPKSFRLVMLFIASYVLFRAKHLLVASPYMANYCRTWHFCRQSIDIIPNAIATCNGVDEDSGTVSRCEKGGGRLEESHVGHAGSSGGGAPVVFVAIANGFKGCKNMPSLLRAFGMLQRLTAVPCNLRLYGWGNENQGEAGIWARRQHLDQNVIFCGRMSHRQLLKDVKASAHVFVHPSLEESFGNVIVEAMSLGLPTIVGKSSGAAPWVAGDGRSGLVVDVRKPREIALAMKAMAENEDLRSEKGRAALALVQERYRMDSVTTQHEVLYRRILGAQVE